MKFSPRTIQLLKNFSTINQSMIFEPGNELKVISELGTVFACAEIEDLVDSHFAIYDMPRFISAVTMFEQPTLEIDSGVVVITDGSERITYKLAEPSLIKAPPKSVITIEPDVTFNFTADQFNRMIKGMAITGASHMCVTGTDGDISIQAVSLGAGSKNINTGASYTQVVGSTPHKFNFVFVFDNIKMLAENYRISISRRGISKFEASDVSYFVAVENTSTFEG